jgi:CBS domain-containing membrane protein
MSLDNWFESFKPRFDPVSFREKFSSAAAAMFAMLLLGEMLRFLPEQGHPLILFASMAAASVLLYAAPHSPMGQPWPLLVGNLLSGAVGLLVSVLIPDPIVAAACAVGLSILVMSLTHSLHPPGAATAMIMVLNAGQIHLNGWQWAAAAVMGNAVLSLFLAIIINNLIHLGRYPAHHHHPHAAVVLSDQLAVQDIEWALGKMEGVVDVDEEDLLEIYRLANEHARKK